MIQRPVATPARPPEVRPSRWIGGALLASLLVSGCALPYRALPLDGDRNARQRPFRQEHAGVVLAADLIGQPAEVRAYFHHALADHDLVPVVMHVTSSGTRACVLQRSAVYLRLEGRPEPLTPVDPEILIGELRRSGTAAALGAPLILPYLVARERGARFNFALERDYRAKSLPDYVRVLPGDPPRAQVIFFRVNEALRDLLSRSPVLEVQAEFEADPATGTPGERVSFLLSLG